MTKYLLQKIFLIGLTLLLGISSLYADGTSTDDLIKLLKKGTTYERLEAAKRIGKLGHSGAKAENKLLKLLKKNKNSSNGIIYLSALLSISDNHQKAYKAFEYRAFKLKGNKYEKARKAGEYLSKLSDVFPVPASLIPYVKALRKTKKIHYTIPNIILSQLIIKNPELTSQFIEELKTEPLNSVRILAQIGESVKPYLSDIKNVMDKAPFDSLKLFLKYDYIDADILKFAIQIARKPVKKNSFYSFSNKYTSWNIAVDILAKRSADMPEARKQLFALINSKDWKYVLKAISKYPAENKPIQKDVLNLIFVKLDNEDDDLSYNENPYRKAFPAYDMCMFIAGQNVSDKSHIDTLLYTARFWSDLIVRVGCTYALSAVKDPPKEVLDYLESALEQDTQTVANQVKILVNSMVSEKNGMVQSQFRSSLAPDLTAFYSASILLKHFPQHKKAKLIIEEYYATDLPFLKIDRTNSKPGHRNLNFPAAISANGTFKAFYSEITPIEALSFAYVNNSSAWNNLIEDGLSSDVYARSINAAQLIIEKKAPITKKMRASLIQKSLSQTNRSQSIVFIHALKYATADDKTITALKEISKEKYIVRKQAAKKILMHFETRDHKDGNTK